jgi:hypothetical protein
MVLSSFKNFGEYRGSLTWVVRDGDAWWCNFAQYGADNAKTVLVKLDAEWRELGAWTYPDSVIEDLGQYSISAAFGGRACFWRTATITSLSTGFGSQSRVAFSS